ncbi:MAG TPA: twin-arginine translocation signal domain-containing protein [Planctomycetaceae bacterium]|nr:twin-arginine translocation signal domain-containing protein [Planctomycetaceae bacterium]
MLNRRDFLAAAGAAAALAPRWLRAADESKPKRIAFLGTEVRRHSHAQHFLDRLTLGYTWGGRWQAPRVEVASVYIDQFPEGDLGKERIERHKLRRFPSIAEALTLGGSELAVDGVVIIAEHGSYPRNEKGQTLYPRYKWFKEVVDVFESSGRAVPVFNDKHLSTTWAECAEMLADARRLGFAFLAGSSLPVTWRMPAVDLPSGAELSESVCVAYGGVDSYDFHALETAQCMSERRRGGEVGIRSVHAVRGERLWSILEGDDRRLTRDLLVAALCRSHNLPVEGGFPTDRVTWDWARRTLPDTLGYLIEHRDGLRTSIFLTAIRDFNYAGYLPATGEIVSCQMYLPMPGHGSTTADFFNPLTRHIEDLILERRAPYPAERTLLTSGMVIGGVESLHRDQTPVETPEMEVRYQVPETSLFWRE